MKAGIDVSIGQGTPRTAGNPHNLGIGKKDFVSAFRGRTALLRL